MQLDRDMVSEVVVEPMLDRGLTPRKDAKVEVLLGDYTEALGMIPRDMLKKAFADVIRDWTYAGWPQPGIFRKAAERYVDLGSDEPRRSSGETKDTTSTVAVRQYVSRRVAADNNRLFYHCNQFGPWFKSRVEAFLTERAFACVESNRAIHIPNADLERVMADFEIDAIAYRRSATEVINRGKGSTSADGSRMLAALRPIHITNPETARLVAQAKGLEPPSAMSEDDYGPRN